MLVGRTLELDVLNASFRQMLEGKGNILFLTGEAGLGKTTLVHEWWKTVAPDSAIYAEAACSIPVGNVDVGRLEALQPWADIVAQLQGHEEQGKKKLDLKKLIFDSAPAWAWAIPIIGDFAHAAVETHRLMKEQQSDDNLNARNQQQVFQQYVNMLAKVSEDMPLVLFLDDMHWADTSSTNLLFGLSRHITGKRILVLATYRSDEAIAANNGKGHPVITVKNEILRYDAGKELALGYLNGDAIRALLTESYPEYELNEALEQWLKKISDGNSLFVTQFIKTLGEDGHLDGHGVFTGEYDTVTIPDSALAVVAERTRRLDEETRQLLSYATAEGEEFTSYVLGQLTAKKPLELLRELKKAEAAGMVQSKQGMRSFANQTTSVFGFSHALFHKALYEGLFPEEREILHRQCYEILKTEWDRMAAMEKPMPLASKLLTHAEKCGQWEAAANAALTAAQSAWRTYAEPEALEMLNHVKQIAERDDGAIPERARDEMRGEALLLHAVIDSLHGRYDSALEAAAGAFGYFQKTRNVPQSVAAMNQRSWVRIWQSKYTESEVEARKALLLAEGSGASYGEANALNYIGLTYDYRGAYDEALQYYTKSLAIREAIGDRQGIAASFGNMGNVYNKRGDHAQALAYFIKSLAIQQETGERDSAATSLNNIGIAYFNLGAYDKAIEYYTKSLALREQIGDRAGIAMTLNNISNVQMERGAYSEALEGHKKSLAIREEIGDRAGIAMSLSNIGNVYSSYSAYDEALDCQTRSLTMREEIGDPASVAISLNNIGDIYTARGDYDEALKYHVKGLSIREQIGDHWGQLWSLCGIGLTYRRMGRRNDARETLERARDVAQKSNMKYLFAFATCELGMLSRDEAVYLAGIDRDGKINEAVLLLNNGIGIFTEMNNAAVKEYAEELEHLKRGELT